jgi:hypothetical protein
MKEEDLIGYWTNNKMNIVLKLKGQVNISWHDSPKKAIGFWKFNEKEISISFIYRGFEQFTSEFKLSGNKYSHKLLLSIVDLDKGKLTVIDTLGASMELYKNTEKTSEIYIREERKEDLLQAYVTMLLISAIAGPIIRWLINPDIPTWLIIAILFIICLFFIRRDKYH